MLKQKGNKKIRNATRCTYKNIKFRSQLERDTYIILKERGIKSYYEPKTFVLMSNFTSEIPFYDAETPEKRKKRNLENNTNSPRLLEFKPSKFQSIKYTPDFYFKVGEYDVWLEIKGKENDIFPLKKKMFINLLNRIQEKEGTKSIYIIAHTKKQVHQALEILAEYE